MKIVFVTKRFIYILTGWGTGMFGQLVHIQILLHLVYSQRAIDGWTARMCNIDPVGNHSTTQSEAHISLLCDEFKGTHERLFCGP